MKAEEEGLLLSRILGTSAAHGFLGSEILGVAPRVSCTLW
jgi:hypothetical protein